MVPDIHCRLTGQLGALDDLRQRAGLSGVNSQLLVFTVTPSKIIIIVIILTNGALYSRKP